MTPLQHPDVSSVTQQYGWLEGARTRNIHVPWPHFQLLSTCTLCSTAQCGDADNRRYERAEKH